MNNTDNTASRPATPKDTFLYGSGTKPFTAAAVLRLVEEGKVRVAVTFIPFYTPLYTFLAVHTPMYTTPPRSVHKALPCVLAVLVCVCHTRYSICCILCVWWCVAGASYDMS